ncbi:Membrane-associated kinase regulator [Actinidia chinensis var. chinensis]|uniref:Membrane-associated kinase regulator n=1 Tax=Actinidia chinensis var. chinensis TaxID=1590841 RepID=A0A2R6Q8I1_ACTCC|nr:Membrane-associated kinase regulator [Actinidia chinensis var. chinensis]
MEVFSLLKHWRGGSATKDIGVNVRTEATATTTIAAAVGHQEADTDEDGDGPFFDLEFSLPGEEEEQEIENDGDEEREDNGDEEREDDIDSDGENEREFDFTISSGSSGDRTDPNATLSPSDDLFFKGQLVPVEPSSTNEPNAKPQFSLFKSATKFRVLMLKLKKSKANVAEKTDPKREEPQNKPNQSQSKLFMVKLKVEEVPIVSLFTRDNISRASSATNKYQKLQSLDEIHESASDEKRFSKDVMQKYLKMVKPLYIRVSKRYGEKLRFSGQLRPSPPSTDAQKSPELKAAEGGGSEQTAVVAGHVKSGKQGKLPARLRVVCKHLGKSSSASASVAAAPPGSVQAKRRDDSLLQQQDGIQGAILHCKRSFHASRDSESSVLSRSVSDPSAATSPCT